MRATALLSLQMFGPKRTPARRPGQLLPPHLRRELRARCRRSSPAPSSERSAAARAASSTWRSRPPRSRASSRSSRPAGSSRRARVIVEKPFGTDLASARELNRGRPLCVRRVARLPDRPLPRQGVGGEHPRAPFRERHVRAGLEPRPHRPRPDRRARDAVDRGPCRVLRGHRARSATWSSRTCSRCSGSSRWSRRRRSTPKALRMEKNKVFEAMKPLDPARVVRGQYEGYRAEAGRRAESRRRRRSSRSRWRSTTGAGPACRSSCVPARAWPQSRQTISLAFREPPLRMFRLAQRHGIAAAERAHDRVPRPRLDLDALPGQGAGARRCDLREAAMTFQYDSSFDTRAARGATSGCCTTRCSATRRCSRDAAGIERLWELSTPLLERSAAKLHRYPEVSWGPSAAQRLIAPRHWCLPDGLLSVSEHARTATITAGVGLVVVVLVRLAMHAGVQGLHGPHQRTADAPGAGRPTDAVRDPGAGRDTDPARDRRLERARGLPVHGRARPQPARLGSRARTASSASRSRRRSRTWARACCSAGRSPSGSATG